MENLAILLSIFSTIVAVISAYLSQFKRGKVVLLPVRAYRLEPGNFHAENESYRTVEMIVNLTFMNTGAITHAINDLRVRIPMDQGELILSWNGEYPSLSSTEYRYPSQPTLGPYGSLNQVYSFCNKTVPAQGKLVMAMEEICEKDANKTYTALIEMRKCRHHWSSLCKISFRHSGRRHFEDDFDKINRI